MGRGVDCALQDCYLTRNSSAGSTKDRRRTTHFGWSGFTEEPHERQISIPMCASTHSQHNPSTMAGAAMVNGIDFPPCFIEEGVHINTEYYIRMLEDVYLPHFMAQTRRAGGRRTSANSIFTLGKSGKWHLATVNSRPKLELRAMIVRAVSALDPEATEKACTTGFIHRCLASVRARGGHFEHRQRVDQVTCTRVFSGVVPE